MAKEADRLRDVSGRNIPLWPCLGRLSVLSGRVNHARYTQVEMHYGEVTFQFGLLSLSFLIGLAYMLTSADLLLLSRPDEDVQDAKQLSQHVKCAVEVLKEHGVRGMYTCVNTPLAHSLQTFLSFIFNINKTLQ